MISLDHYILGFIGWTLSLRLFLIIKRSITKASHLCIAQPALDLYLRRLEDELGVELVTRHAEVTPTAAKQSC